jgi:hypothetical protein
MWTAVMAVLVGFTITSTDGSHLVLDITVGVASLALVPLLARWPVQAAVLLSLLAALSPAATPPATMAVLLVACWRRFGVAAAVAGIGIAAHLVRGAWEPISGLPYGWYAVLVCVAYAALAGWGTLIRAHQELIFSLRDDSLPDLTAGRSPLPGVADLPGLIGESRAAGMLIETAGAAWPATGGPGTPASAGAAAGVPDVAGRTAYRVVQEGLTNARKHAPGEPVQVTLGGGPGAGLDVAVVNRLGSAPASASAAVPGTGTGLIGLTERLELAGGTLDWRDTGDEFRLRAWLPWPQAAGLDATEHNGRRVQCD